MTLMKTISRVLVFTTALILGCQLTTGYALAADGFRQGGWQCPPSAPAAEEWLIDTLEDYRANPSSRHHQVGVEALKHGVEVLKSEKDAAICAARNEYNAEVLAGKTESPQGEAYYKDDVIYYRGGPYYFDVYIYYPSTSEAGDIRKARAHTIIVRDADGNMLFGQQRTQ